MATDFNTYKEKELNMSDTLVIHPKDNSTIMLEYVYKDKGFDVINNPDIPRNELIKQIQNHRRIIMLGHGVPDGLINPALATKGFNIPNPFVIDDSIAPYLKDKETISMWCYSDEYFRRNNLPGFHTGMIISERKEALYMLGSCPLTDKQLFDNMIHLSKLLGECIDYPAEVKREYILNHYVGNDAITQFNRERIRVN